MSEVVLGFSERGLDRLQRLRSIPLAVCAVLVALPGCIVFRSIDDLPSEPADTASDETSTSAFDSAHDVPGEAAPLDGEPDATPGDATDAAASGDAGHTEAGDAADAGEAGVASDASDATPDGTADAAVCAIGERRCSGKMVETCKTDRTGFVASTTCAIGCAAGACLKVVDMPTELSHVCVVLSDGTVRCWGSDGPETGSAPLPHNVPVPVPGITNAVSITVAAGSSGVRLADSSLRWWGRLYSATAPGYADVGSPVAIPGIPAGTMLMLGPAMRVCAIQSDATVKCYGNGPFGDGGASGWAGAYTTAKTVPGLTGIVSGTISALADIGFVIDGTGAKGWGSNDFGQLGNGYASEFLTAQATYAFATQISGSGDHTCAVIAGGAVRCSGKNDVGQLGLGATTTTDYLSPTDVPTLSTGVKQVCTGHQLSCAVLNDKTVRCWGDNYVGQIGDGTTTRRPSPTTVAGLPPAVKVGCNSSGAGACALLESGEIRCWGVGVLLGGGASAPAFKSTPTAPAW